MRGHRRRRTAKLGPKLHPAKSLSTESTRTAAPFSSGTTIMSRASKLTLAATSLGAIGIVIFVHYSQRAEKAVRALFNRLLFLSAANS